MQQEFSQFVWLLPLLLFSSTYLGSNAIKYNQQVITILEDNPVMQKAAHFLYQKHDTTSYMVKWNSDFQLFQRVQWNEETQLHEILSVQEPLPINRYEWRNTRIQVVGHGDIHAKTTNATLAGFSAEVMAETLTNGLSKGDVGRISIVGCARQAEVGSAASENPHYLISFMDKLKQLGRTRTEASIRSALISTDSSGRKLTGELVLSESYEVAIKWSHKNPSNKWIGEFTNGSFYQIEQSKVTDMQPGDIESHFFGILPENSDVHISTFATSPSATYKMSDSSAFQWVDRVSQNTYRNIPRGRANEVSRRVQFLTGTQDERDVHIREIHSIRDLLRELHYYGETGPALRHSKVYYRFGDWVLSMDTGNFHVSIEGVITTPKDSSQKVLQVGALRQAWRNFPNQRMPEDYPTMQPQTGVDFFDNVKSWMNGDHNRIGLTIGSAYNAQCGTAMFLSESIRSFQNHITNMMSLDLVHHGYLSKEYFFRSHPMSRGFTWQVKRNIHNREVKKTGLEMLQDADARAGRLVDVRAQRVFNSIISRISRISKSWLSHIDTTELKGSRDAPPQATAELYTGLAGQASLLTLIEDIGSVRPNSRHYLRVYELREATNLLLSAGLTEPEASSVDMQIEEFSSTEDISSPLRASMALANDHAYMSELISRQVRRKELQTGKQYEVIPDSLVVGQNDNSVRFRLQGTSDPASRALISTTIDKAKLTSKALLDDLQAKLSEVQQPGHPDGRISRINRGLAIYSVIRGLRGSIRAFENSNITERAFGLAQSLHGIGELGGNNRAVYKAAGKGLGQILNAQVEHIGASVSTIAGEDAGELLRAAGGEVLSTVGDVGDLLEDVPVLGTAFGVYNIYEDYQQHSTLGYIDAGLDIAVSGLSIIGPEAEPIVVALTIIRMGIDTFYNDISNELTALPPDATISQKVDAVFKGIGNMFVDLFEELTLPGQIIGAIETSHNLDNQFNEDKVLLRQLSDYHGYFNIVKEEGSGSSEIGGSASWNGGDITFHLGESGRSTLSFEAADSSGRLLQETHTVATDGVQDIVVGIGQSHSISFKKQTAKLLWFIPVHSRTLITSTHGERQTLHGSYYSNSHANSFFAVQELPPLGNHLGYNLDDYHYKLYGMGGDDTFFLGPQHSYVEGNEGSDTYFVNSSSVYTEINNYADDEELDYLIFNLDYSQLVPRRLGLNLHITSTDNTHTILVTNWFHDVLYQHMIFKTRDGVLFKVSATGSGQAEFIPYALSGAMATQPQIFEAREHGLSQVMTIIGSNHDDIINGNDMNNQLNGGRGDDILTGGKGKDVYTVDLYEGMDTINNYATDGETDILIFAARVDDIVSFSRPSTNDLYLSRVGSTGNQQTGAVIRNWFLSDSYRHMILVSEDGVVLNISSTKDSSVKLQPIMMDMSTIQVGAPTEPPEPDYFYFYSYYLYEDPLPSDPSPNTQQRQVDLSSDPLLSKVVTTLGSPHDDTMIGNHKDNYMTGGKGHDTMEGRDGRDVYVVKEGDGKTVINNFAEDGEMDTLLLSANYEEIQLSSLFGDLVLSAHSSAPEKRVEVTVKEWFYGGANQHMVVRSADGVVFELPTTEYMLTKTAKFIDNSKLTTNTNLTLTGEWSQVERVLGSTGNDTILGNSLSNYIDPGKGRSLLIGNNGSDTYVIRNYGKGNVINNHAIDDCPDTLVFAAPFSSIRAKISGNDIQLTSITSKGHLNTRLRNYVSKPKNRHLTVFTEDGYSFVLPEVSNYKPVPIIINRAQAATGQHINLTASNTTFSEVRTVYGSTNYQNCIAANQQDNTIIGGSQADILEGLDGNDVLKGGAGNDTLLGGPGADILVGGDGGDRIEGEEGDDIISPGLGANWIDGGEGTDTVIYSGEVSTGNGIHLNLQHHMCIHAGRSEDVLHGIENAYGTEFDDVLQGDDEDNVLLGQGGNDYIIPGSGYDVLNGGNGRDTYDLAAANGTVAIHNYATDGALDKVLMTYANISELRYEKSNNDLVVRVIDVQYPVFYDVMKPTVVFKGWFINPRKYHHIHIDAADGRIEASSLKRHAREAAARATELTQ